MTTATLPPTGTRSRNSRKPRSRSIQLRAIAARVRSHPRRTLGQAVSLGRLLIEAQRLTDRGRFPDWFASIGPQYALRTARLSMLMARRCGDLPLPLGRFTVAAGQLISKRKVARSRDLIDVLADLVRRPGPIIGWAEVRAAISAVAPAAIYPRKERIQDRESPAEALARRLIDLICAESVTSLYIAASHGPDEPTVTLTVMGARPQTVTREYLTTALAAAVGEEELRRCPHPAHKGPNPLPPTSFSKCAHYCKKCDRQRVKEYEAKKKARKGGGKSAAPADAPVIVDGAPVPQAP